MNRTRVFVSVNVGEPSKSELVRWMHKQALTLPKLRWTPDEQLHVTVKFLGEVDDRDIPPICEMLAECCEQFPEFDLSTGPLGTFPTGKAARVLWIGVQDPSLTLHRLFEDLERRLESVGIPPEGRQFQPHITLARIPKNRESDSMADTIQELDLQGTFGVRSIELMASIKERGRFAHQTMAEFKLQRR